MSAEYLDYISANRFNDFMMHEGCRDFIYLFCFYLMRIYNKLNTSRNFSICGLGPSRCSNLVPSRTSYQEKKRTIANTLDYIKSLLFISLFKHANVKNMLTFTVTPQSGQFAP